jgi:YjbE family integral membrane protein
VGGLLQLWIGYRLVRPVEEGAGRSRHGASFWESVWIIVVADITMSLDNVLAVAAAAHGDMVLVTLGIAMSVPIVVWGSGVLAGLMNRYPWIIWAGGGLLGYVAGDMMLEDPLLAGWLGPVAPSLEYPVPGALAVALTGIGWWLARPEPRHT